VSWGGAAGQLLRAGLMHRLPPPDEAPFSHREAPAVDPTGGVVDWSTAWLVVRPPSVPGLPRPPAPHDASEQPGDEPGPDGGVPSGCQVPAALDEAPSQQPAAPSQQPAADVAGIPGSRRPAHADAEGGGAAAALDLPLVVRARVLPVRWLACTHAWLCSRRAAARPGPCAPVTSCRGRAALLAMPPRASYFASRMLWQTGYLPV